MRTYQVEDGGNTAEPIRPTIDFSSINNLSWTTRVCSRSAYDRTSFPATVEIEDLKASTSALVDVLSDRIFGADRYARGAYVFNEKIREVARCGRTLFENLIPEGRRDEFLECLRAATLLLPTDKPVRGEVILYEAALRIWWPYLYTAVVPEEGPVDIKHFLGSEFVFLACAAVQTFSRDNPEMNLFSSINYDDCKTNTGHVWDNKLLVASLPEDERWYSELPDIHSRKELQPPLTVAAGNAAQKADHYRKMKDQLFEFVTRGWDTLHLDCHGLSKPATQWKINLGVRDDFEAENADIMVWNFIGNRTLIAVLNVCLAGRGQLGERTTSFAEALIQNGVRAVVAPMTKVPLEVLMDASRILYRHLIDGQSALQAVDAAQREFLDSGNPIGHALILHVGGFPAATTTFERTHEPTEAAI